MIFFVNSVIPAPCVIPAKAGIHGINSSRNPVRTMDTRLRGYDSFGVLFHFAVFCIFIMALLTGCATQNGRNDRTIVSLGDVKITFFQTGQGKNKNGQQVSVCGYIAVLSRERNYKYGNKLNEVFEEVTAPKIVVVADDTIGDIFDYLNKEKYFDLPQTPLARFNIDDLKKLDCFAKVINVDINGMIYTVSYEGLDKAQQKTFNYIQQVIFAAITAGKSQAAIERQDWKEIVPVENK